MRHNYHCVWRVFSNFYLKLDVKPNNWEDRITLFVGYLIENNKKHTTINSYISALKTVLREDGWKIPEDHCLLNSLIRACKRHNTSVCLRLPIQKQLLHEILKQIDIVYLTARHPQPYLAALYKAIIVTAYYGLLRIGEVTTGTHPVLAKDIHITQNKKKLLLVLHSSKTHCDSDVPQTIKITSSSKVNYKKDLTKTNINKYCPYILLRHYVKMRPKYACDQEQFFCFQGQITSESNTHQWAFM